MSMVGRVLLVALVGATLAACGGGDGATALPNKQAGQGITVGEPNGGVPVVSEYIKLAQEASCAEARNNLYLVDNKYVFWDRAGRCADASYAQTLMGATPQAVLCQSGQTIAGPRTVCTAEGPQALFETMVKNLDKDDLGLGAGHKVEAIPFLPKSGTAIAFTQVVSQAFSSITAPRQVVVKDAAAWAALWAEHNQSGNPAPEVDFSRNMVVALFAGETASGCKSTSIVKVVSRDGKMVVEYQERDLATLAPCLPVVTQPMQVVSVPRVDAKVEFLKAASEDAAYRTIDQTTQSGVRTERNVVVRDGATWAALWLEHAGSDKVIPDIDFGKEMVIAVFAGGLPTGCHSSGIESIRFADGKLNVVRVDTLPRPEVVCTAMMVYPAQLVTVERSDVPVEFSKQTRTTK